jgi:hypothetical protein
MAPVVASVALILLALEEIRAVVRVGLRLEFKVIALHQVREGRAEGRAAVREG